MTPRSSPCAPPTPSPTTWACSVSSRRAPPHSSPSAGGARAPPISESPASGSAAPTAGPPEPATRPCASRPRWASNWSRRTRPRPSPPPSTNSAAAVEWRSSRPSPAPPPECLRDLLCVPQRIAQTPRESGAGEESDRLFGLRQGGAGDLLGLLGAPLQHGRCLARVLGQLDVALTDGAEKFHQCRRRVRLQWAVLGVLLGELFGRPTGAHGQDRQQVGDARL